MELFAGLAFGFAGSLHCIGMCGPIALALPGDSARKAAFVGSRIAYNAGRIVTYSALGAGVGLFGGSFVAPVLQQNLSILVGATIILTAAFPWLLRKIAGGGMLRGLSGALGSAMSRLLGRQSAAAYLALGLLNGLLPCGFVVLALAAAVVSADVVGGMLFMAGFGGGTLPAMLGVSLFPGFVPQRLRSRLGWILPSLSIIVGVLLIVRGLNLGVPYLSPRISAQENAVQEFECCH